MNVYKAQIPQFKEFFLDENNYTRKGSKQVLKQTADRVMLQRWGELMRKIWKNHHYRPHVSPHEFLQSVVLASKGRFQFTKRGNAGEFLTWFINSLHAVHKKISKSDDTIIRRCMEGKIIHSVRPSGPWISVKSMLFSGEMVVNNRRIPNPELSDEEKRKLYQLPKYKSDGIDHNQPFLFLTLDLPPKPLYVDPHKQISIPQVSF